VVGEIQDGVEDQGKECGGVAWKWVTTEISSY